MKTAREKNMKSKGKRGKKKEGKKEERGGEERRRPLARKRHFYTFPRRYMADHFRSIFSWQSAIVPITPSSATDIAPRFRSGVETKL